MSLFKKLADLARESNDRWVEKEMRAQQSEMREERAYEKKLALRNVCGNCPYYEYGKCIKHRFSFSPDELRDGVQYERTCDDFFRY